ncbi:unnamed protein product [Sphagnum troendelagicum]
MAMAITRTPLFDVHCHLQDNRILDTAPSLIKAATKAGVKWMAVNGTSEADWEKVRQMSEHNSCIIPCFGLHPWWASQRSKDWLSKLRCMLQSVPCSTVGEIGLCQSIRGREVEESIQVDVLRQQLELARELERPAAIHCVRAFRSLQGLLEEMGSFPAGIILHSYSGSPEFVKVFAKHGAYFSFSGFNTHVKPQKARRIWQQVPRDRLLLETDCPDALPQVDDPTALFWVPGDPAATAAVPSSNSDCCHEEELHSKSAGNGRGGIGKGALNQPANLRAILSHVASLLEASDTWKSFGRNSGTMKEERERERESILGSCFCSWTFCIEFYGRDDDKQVICHKSQMNLQFSDVKLLSLQVCDCLCCHQV